MPIEHSMAKVLKTACRICIPFKGNREKEEAVASADFSRLATIKRPSNPALSLVVRGTGAQRRRWEVQLWQRCEDWADRLVLTRALRRPRG